jgi:DNA-binding MarR family transcriptional regulator
VRQGFELPLLLAAAFRALIDELHEELAGRGHPGVRPVHGFALQAVGAGGATVSELGRRLGISKQAAAKTAASLKALGYVASEPDPVDGRARVLRLTAHGTDCLRTSAEIFERLRARWVTDLGEARVAALEDDLEAIAGHGSARLGDLPGWLR